VAEGVAGDVEIGQHPIVVFVAPEHLLVDHVDVVGGDEVVDDEVFEFELFLEDAATLLETFDFFCIHFLQLFIFILEIFESFDFLFDLKFFIFILLL
jgi:hypothetical protein